MFTSCEILVGRPVQKVHQKYNHCLISMDGRRLDGNYNLLKVGKTVILMGIRKGGYRFGCVVSGLLHDSFWLVFRVTSFWIPGVISAKIVSTKGIRIGFKSDSCWLLCNQFGTEW